jgi:iron complex outermembrane recepter protein
MPTKIMTRLLAGTAVSALLTGAAFAAGANARPYDIPQQDAATALQAYAMQSGKQVLFPYEAAKGKQAPQIKGDYSDQEVIALLANSAGLRVTADDGKTVTLRPQASAAAEGGDEGTVQALIVTAQKREENIQDVPIAMSAFTQEDLTRSQVAGGPDLMTQVPNFTFTKTNFSGYSIQIRGIGTQAISATTDPAVAVAFNNTPFIRNRFFEQEFYDLERVEVLRGPQGTLYGRNATAGVVNILSAKPVFHYEAKLSGDVANYNSTRLEGMVNIPLIEDKAALRIAGAWTKRDGYVKNRLTGQQTDGRDLWSSRVTLRLDPAQWLNVNLIWEHFEESDDRLRTGKQLCHSDPGPSEVNGVPILQQPATIDARLTVGYVSQGCLPASLYSPDSFDTPNGYALPYYGPLGILGLPVYFYLNPYTNTFQSRNLREIETHLKPEYTAKTDTAELQLKVDLPWNLSLASETGYNRDHIFSFEDYNRFDTTPGVFIPGGAYVFLPEDYTGPGPNLDIVDINGTFCDPQLGCTNRLAAGDLSTARSTQFAQEFRLSSDWDGSFNFNFGANFLRYDTVEKYYVFINTLTMWEAYKGKGEGGSGLWQPGVSDNGSCYGRNFYGPVESDPTAFYSAFSCAYIDPNDIHHLNDQGRNYFLSKNPYHLLSYAAFGEAYYNVTPNLKVTAGLRWTIDKKTAPVIPSWLLAGGAQIHTASTGSYGTPTYKVIEQEWRKPTGRLAVDWKPDLSFTDETLVYGSYVRGYKAGGANPPPPVLVLATICPPQCGQFGNPVEGKLAQHYLTHPETFAPEYVNAYEIGTKNTLLDGRLTANLSAFYYDYTGYQISQIVDRSALNFNFDAKIWGAELELDWRPLENLRLGFKGGYENTRVADGQQAIDTMDRTAGKEGWMILRPFPTLPSNCVVPTWLMEFVGAQGVCAAYSIGVDPVTYLPYVANPTETGFGRPIPTGYPGYNPSSANDGQGFLKDLSGNKLPNAPKFTTTVTADYTLPLANDWLMTLHADLYRQSEAWTRIFNTPGYDKLKAYNNVNMAAIFSNEDRGWQVMAYVKNVFDKDNITGAFLNSDDTGLTTNVFLNEPRLYGLRVTKSWTGGSGWIAGGHKPGEPYLLTVEAGAQAQRLDAPGEIIMPYADAFTGAFDPTRPQREDLPWIGGTEIRVSYRPQGSPWKIAGGVRYGRTSDSTGRVKQSEIAGDSVCKLSLDPKYLPFFPGQDLSFINKLQCDPTYGPVTKTLIKYNGTPFTNTFPKAYAASNIATPTNRLSYSTDRKEDHLLVDFLVGKDVGIGRASGVSSSVDVGLRYAEFNSELMGDMRGVPDVMIPAAWGSHNSTYHQYIASFDTERRFTGAGPTVSWEGARILWGNHEAGHLDVDWTATGGVLFGRQKTSVTGSAGSEYFNGIYPERDWVINSLPPPAQTPLDIAPRNKLATVPLVDLSLGLSYEIPGVKLSTGYRWERYFNVLDDGFEQHKSYDRTIDGPYVKVAIGFGG